MQQSSVTNPAETPPNVKGVINRRRKLRNALIASAVALVLYTLFGFFAVPLIIRKLIVPRLAERLNGSLTLARAATNPFTFECTLEDLQLNDFRGVRTLAFDRLEINLQTWPTIFTRGYHFERLIVTRPFLRAEVLKERQLNLLTLLRPAPLQPTGQPDEPWTRIPRVRVARVVVESGDLLLRDESLSTPFEAEWSGLTVSITPLDWDPDHQSPLKLVTTTPRGERFEVTADVVSQPLLLSGDLKLTGLRLAEFMPYFQEYADGRIADGTLSADVTFAFGPTQSPPVAMAHIRSAAIETFALTGSVDPAPLVSLRRASVENAIADAATRSFNITQVSIVGASVDVVRAADGSIGILSALGLADSAVQSSTPVPIPYPVAAARQAVERFIASRPRVDPASVNFPVERFLASVRNLVEDMGREWDWNLEQLSVSDTKASWNDHAASPVARVGITNIEASIGPVRRADRWRVPLQADFSVAPSGKVAVSGSLRALDRDLEFTIKLSNIDLSPLASYPIPGPSTEVTTLRMTSATAAAEGVISAALAADGEARAAFNGTAALDTFALEGAPGQTLLRFQRLVSTGSPQVSLTSSGDASALWSGSLQLTAASVDAALLPLGDLAFDDLRVEGKASTNLNQGLSSAEFTGKLVLSAPSLDGRFDDLRWAAARSFSIDGAAMLKGTASTLDASYSGSLEILNASGSSPKNKLDSASVESAALRGEAVLSQHDQRFEASWTGSTSISGLAASGPVAGTVEVAASAVSHIGRLAAAIDPSAPNQISLSGDASIANLNVGAPELARFLAEHAATTPDQSLVTGPVSFAVTTAEARGIDIILDLPAEGPTPGPNSSIALAAVMLQSPQLDAQTRLAPPTDVDDSASATGTRAPSRAGLGLELPFRFKLDSLTIADGSARIRDASGAGGAETEVVVDSLALTMTGLDSAAATPAAIDASMNISGSGRASARGTVSPFDQAITADLTLSVERLPLKPYDPISGRFVGYSIDSGRMDVRIPLAVRERRINGEIDFRFDQLYLGRSVDSPDAPNIPVKLGLALLRDSQDRVAGEIPFDGNMTDPSFSLSGVIWQAFFGLFAKAATAPFELLGAIFGGGDDISSLTFGAGAADVSSDQLSRLDKLARALRERPALVLRIVPTPPTEGDLTQLRVAMVPAAMLERARQRSRELTVLSPERLEDEIRSAYFDLLKSRGQERPRRADLPTVEAMTAEIAATFDPPADAIVALVAARADSVARILTAELGIDPARVITAPTSDRVLEVPTILFELDAR